MHVSLMRRCSARIEVARDNMCQGGITSSFTLDVYSMTSVNEQVEVASRVVEAELAESCEACSKNAIPRDDLPKSRAGIDSEPSPEPQAIFCPARDRCKLSIVMAGERGFEPSTSWSLTGSV